MAGKRRRQLCKALRLLRRHPWRTAICLLLLAAAATGFLTWRWMLSQSITQEELECFYPSRCCYDARGNLLDVRRGGAYQWRFPVKLEEIPPQMVADVLTVEDATFFDHCGIEWRSALRAAWQLVRYRRIVSGASTLTMQLVNQFEEKPKRRTIVYKLRQCGRALNWERTHTKQETLEEYFNRLPYGGMVTGIQAASQFYFGRPVSQLNRSEQLLLTGLPQGPNLYRPDRHPERALQRRDRVLGMLVRAGSITAAEAEEIKGLPLRYRDFTIPAWPVSEDTDFLEAAAEMAALPPGAPVRTTMFPEIQRTAREMLRESCQSLQGVGDGSVVVIDTATGDVRALVGNAGLDPTTIQVNGALAWRSPGSVLKPFIYGEAIDGGMLSSETILEDSQLELHGYSPGNADGFFRGKVTATEALASSLNPPAIRILQRLTVPRMLRLLAPLHLFKKLEEGDEAAIDAFSRRTGLTFAIGGLESQLLALTAAYSAFGCNRPPRLLAGGAPGTPAETRRYWAVGSTQLLLRMLRSHRLPLFDGDAAWKTGTSNGNRDAWCIAVTPRWTVGVWLGNKNGRPADTLIGTTAAAPLAGALLAYLHQGEPSDWAEHETALETTLLCTQSGLAPSPFCQKLQPGTTAAEVPLARCQACRQGAAAARMLREPRLLSPLQGTYRRSKGQSTVTFLLDCEPESCHVYIDGSHLGIRRKGDEIGISAGRHQLFVWPGEGYRGKSITVEVK